MSGKIVEDFYIDPFENEMYYRYYDKNGVELHEDDFVFVDGVKKKLVSTVNGELGTDATNHVWIEKGRSFPFEFGVYPLTNSDMENIEKA